MSEHAIWNSAMPEHVIRHSSMSEHFSACPNSYSVLNLTADKKWQEKQIAPEICAIHRPTSGNLYANTTECGTIELGEIHSCFICASLMSRDLCKFIPSGTWNDYSNAKSTRLLMDLGVKGLYSSNCYFQQLTFAMRITLFTHVDVGISK